MTAPISPQRSELSNKFIPRLASLGRWVFGLSLLLAACLLAHQRGILLTKSWRRSPVQLHSASASDLCVDPSALDLGTIWEQPNFKLSVPVLNISDHEVVIGDFFSSCSCTGIEPRPL